MYSAAVCMQALKNIKQICKAFRVHAALAPIQSPVVCCALHRHKDTPNNPSNQCCI